MTDTRPTHPSEKVYMDSAHLSIRWNGDIQSVVVEWKAWTDSAAFRAAYDLVLVAIRENRGSRLLIDLRKARVLGEEDQKWIVEDWGPRSVQAGVRRRAIVAPERSLPRTISDSVRRRVPTGLLEVRAFGTLEEAVGWLSS
jgi:hypothetical protein